MEFLTTNKFSAIIYIFIQEKLEEIIINLYFFAI